jgi:ElaB/YqjD/DUF883 family membrane-anchored ribosome-binding protein
MESIDIYNSFDMNRARRIGRNAKLIYNFSRYGSKAIAKTNPATVYIDAIISVGEAVVSFYEYKRAKEITAQLLFELEEVKKKFENNKIELKKIEEVTRKQNEFNIKEIQKELKNSKDEWNDIFKPIYEHSKKYLYQCKERLEKIKKEYPDSDRIKDIERKYQEAIEAHITATLFIIGG